MKVIKNKRNSKILLILSFVVFVFIFSMNSYDVKATGMGYFDTADCNNLVGWACDSNSLYIPAQVTFIVYNSDSTPSTIPTFAMPADQPRQLPGYSWSCYGTPNHGFSFSTPNSLKNGQAYLIYAQVSGVYLGGIPKSLGPCVSTTCPDSRCDPGENCPADNSACPQGQSCTNGCVVIPGGLTANPNTVSINVGSTSSPITITGGTGPYRIKSGFDNTKVTSTPAVGQTFTSTFTVRGDAQGSTNIVVEDSASTPNSVAVSVTVTTGGGLCTPLTSPPPPFVPSFSGPYGPNPPTNNPADYTTDDARAWRIATCYPADKNSMGAWENEYNRVFDPDIRRLSSTSDKALFPNAGWKDMLLSSATWQFAQVDDLCANNGDCLSNQCVNDRCTCTGNSQCKTGLTCNSGVCGAPPSAGCGNGVVDGTEECDDGADKNGICPAKCSTSCTLNNCGGDGDKNKPSCNDPTGTLPSVSSSNPAKVKKGDLITIGGSDLTHTVQFYSLIGPRYTFVGEVNPECTTASIHTPDDLPPGDYTLKIYKAADKISNGKPITVIGSILKYTPDGDASGYCSYDSECLLNPNSDKPCINSGEYSNDNYCENGNWSTRTKLLVLKLLKIKSGDYSLFCDNIDNTLNYIQYNTDSGQLVSNILYSLDTNNFCVLKTGNKIIIATSTNKDYEQVPNSLNIFGVTSCSNAKDDGNYYSCDSSNKIWYNKKLKIFIYSQTSFSAPPDAEQPSTLIGIIKKIIDAIKRLIIKPPFDESYVSGIKKFNKLYLAQQGSSSIAASLEGKNLKNAVIEYNNFGINICSYIDYYSSIRNFVLSGISCKKENNNYYVLAQGSQFTNLDPDTIWTDLTSKLRVK